METSIQIDSSRLHNFLERVPAMADRLMREFKSDVGELVQGEMVREAPFDRGILSMLILVDESQPDAVVVKSTAAYTRWVVGGTGIFGPAGRRIFPVRAQALRFKIGGRTVFARSVKGMVANPFIERAKTASVPKVKELVARLVREAYQ